MTTLVRGRRLPRFCILCSAVQCTQKQSPAHAGPSGGEGGIRTPGAREGTTVFKTAAFNHSATSPLGGENTAWLLPVAHHLCVIALTPPQRCYGRCPY